VKRADGLCQTEGLRKEDAELLVYLVEELVGLTG
jgi:hypothetical protein